MNTETKLILVSGTSDGDHMRRLFTELLGAELQPYQIEFVSAYAEAKPRFVGMDLAARASRTLIATCCMAGAGRAGHFMVVDEIPEPRPPQIDVEALAHSIKEHAQMEESTPGRTPKEYGMALHRRRARR